MQYVDPNIEATVKFFVNPKNWAESKIGVDWKALGKRHDRDFSSDDDEWKAKGESIYSSSTTLSIKELVESSPRYYLKASRTLSTTKLNKGKHPRVYVFNCWQIFQRTATNDFDGIIYERKL